MVFPKEIEFLPCTEPFRFLVTVILSGSSTDKMAMISAEKLFGVFSDPKAISEAKREEIVAFAQREEIDPAMLTDFISEYEFSGTMDAGNVRDRIEKPMPLLKKRSLVNKIVDFIRQHAEKFQ